MDLKELQDQVKQNDANIRQLQQQKEKKSKQLSQLQQEIDESEHNINFKNEQIEAFENFGLEQKKEEKQEKLLQKTQRIKLYENYQENTQKQVKKYLDKYLEGKIQEVLDRKMQNNIKLEVQSVNIYFISENPTIKLKKQQAKHQIDMQEGEEFETMHDNNGNDDMSTEVDFSVQVFSITKKTKLKDLFESAKEFWQADIDQRLVNQYQLFDVSMSNLELLLETNVENFFLQNKDQYQYSELILTNTDPFQMDMLHRQTTAIKTAGEQGGSNLDESGKQAKQHFKQIFNQFGQVMPGLKQYKKKRNKIHDEELEKLEDISLGMIIFKFILNISTIVLILITLFGQRDFQFLSEVKINMSDKLNYKGDLSIESIYNEILSIQYYIEEKEVDDGEGNITMVDSMTMVDRVIVGPIRVLQIRTENVECENNIHQQFLCSENQYSNETKFKDSIEGSSQPYTQYRKQSETKMGPYSSYSSGYFDGSGYLFDIKPYQKKEVLLEQIQELKQIEWLNYQTKLLVISRNLYDINREQFQTMNLILEFTSSGLIKEKFEFYFFTMYDENKDSHQYNALLDLINFIQIIIFALLSIISDLVYKIRYLKYEKQKTQKLLKKKKKGVKPFKYQDHLGVFLDFNLILNIFALFVAFGISEMYQKPDDSLEQILESNEYINLINYGKRQEQALKYKAILFILMATQLIQSFQLVDKVQLILSIFQSARKPLMMIMIFLFAVIAGYSAIYQYIFGPKLEIFSTFQESFFSFTFMYFFGDYEIKKQIENANEQTALIISFITLLTVFFGVVSIFHSIMHENYRLMEDRTDIFDATGKVKKKSKKLFKKITNFILCKKQAHIVAHHSHHNNNPNNQNNNSQ